MGLVVRASRIAVAAAIVAGAAACVGGGSARPAACRDASSETPDRTICRSAVRYSEAKLGTSEVSVLRLRVGGGSGDCAMAEVRTQLGDRRVLFAATGKPGEDLWQPFAVSAAFRWGDYVPDSDVNCGLYNAGLLSKRDLSKTGYATS
jgi:hypothetical protein